MGCSFQRREIKEPLKKASLIDWFVHLWTELEPWKKSQLFFFFHFYPIALIMASKLSYSRPKAGECACVFILGNLAGIYSQCLFSCSWLTDLLYWLCVHACMHAYVLNWISTSQSNWIFMLNALSVLQHAEAAAAAAFLPLFPPIPVNISITGELPWSMIGLRGCFLTMAELYVQYTHSLSLNNLCQ